MFLAQTMESDFRPVRILGSEVSVPLLILTTTITGTRDIAIIQNQMPNL